MVVRARGGGAEMDEVLAARGLRRTGWPSSPPVTRHWLVTVVRKRARLAAERIPC